MAIDLYVREVDSLRFELSMTQCSERFARLAHEILEKGLLAQNSFETLLSGSSSCLVGGKFLALVFNYMFR